MLVTFEHVDNKYWHEQHEQVLPATGLGTWPQADDPPGQRPTCQGPVENTSFFGTRF